MEQGYQPKYPRAKLREIVTKQLRAFRLAGLGPNCTVAFGESASSAPHAGPDRRRTS